MSADKNLTVISWNSCRKSYRLASKICKTLKSTYNNSNTLVVMQETFWGKIHGFVYSGWAVFCPSGESEITYLVPRDMLPHVSLEWGDCWALMAVGKVGICGWHNLDLDDLINGRGAVSFRALTKNYNTFKRQHNLQHTILACDLNATLPPNTEITGNYTSPPLKSHSHSMQQFGLQTFCKLGTTVCNTFEPPSDTLEPWTRGHNLSLEARSQIDFIGCSEGCHGFAETCHLMSKCHYFRRSDHILVVAHVKFEDLSWYAPEISFPNTGWRPSDNDAVWSYQTRILRKNIANFSLNDFQHCIIDEALNTPHDTKGLRKWKSDTDMTHISPSIASLRKSISAATTPSARTAAVKRLRKARRDRRRYRTNAKLSTISLARSAPSRVPMTLSIAGKISTCRSDWREEAARFGRVRFGQASPASGHVCNKVHHKPSV